MASAQALLPAQDLFASFMASQFPPPRDGLLSACQQMLTQDLEVLFEPAQLRALGDKLPWVVALRDGWLAPMKSHADLARQCARRSNAPEQTRPPCAVCTIPSNDGFTSHGGLVCSPCHSAMSVSVASSAGPGAELPGGMHVVTSVSTLGIAC